MSRNYAALPHDYLKEMEMLSDAEFGRLCRALLKYSKDEETPTLSGNERFFFPRVKMQEDRFQASYDDLSKIRQNAGRQGGRPQKQTKANESKEKQTKANESKEKQTKANESKKTYTETETNTETKEEKRPSHAHARETGADEAAFAAFWSAYPRKVGKEAARKSFAKLRNVDLSVLLQAIEAQKRSDQWNRENGRFIPNPATWLKEGRWEDEITAGAGGNAVRTAGGEQPSFAELAQELAWELADETEVPIT